MLKFFSKRCINCHSNANNKIYSKEASSLLFNKIIRVEALHAYLCDHCYSYEKESKQREIQEEEKVRDEERKSEYYHNLKRKVEIAELEKKAAELGIELEK